VLTNFRLETTLAAELQAAARRGGYGWQVTEQRPSPAVFPGVVDAEYLDSVWSASRRKAIRRAYRKLEAYGPLRLRLITDAAEIPRSVDRFLELERNSWKGTAKTALASTPSDKAFVEEMVVGMAARGNVVMSELLVGERVAAAAINLVMGEVLCAFKIGWSLELARASPGMVHEVELMRRFAGPLAGYSLLDGCTNPESYLSRLWPSQIPVGTVVIGTSSRARMMMAFATFARSIKRSGR
jgi:CelD/BcsL family acetyltransferase involved in cellulose biosynthesis